MRLRAFPLAASETNEYLPFQAIFEWMSSDSSSNRLFLDIKLAVCHQHLQLFSSDLPHMVPEIFAVGDLERARNHIASIVGNHLPIHMLAGKYKVCHKKDIPQT